MTWTHAQYREGGAALTALTARSVTVLGVEWEISACTGDWRASLAQVRDKCTPVLYCTVLVRDTVLCCAIVVRDNQFCTPLLYITVLI